MLFLKKNIFMNTNQDNRIEELKKIIKPYVQNQEAIETLSEETDFIKDLQIKYKSCTRNH